MFKLLKDHSDNYIVVNTKQIIKVVPFTSSYSSNSKDSHSLIILKKKTIQSVLTVLQVYDILTN